jgi:MoaA/NifB/PqqE/SkfB family radical SAM enzyme
LAEYAQITDSLLALPIFAVGFGGGEPIERPDFLSTVARLSGAAVYCHFTTNGWLVDKAMAARIHHAGTARVAVSFDGWSRDEHDLIRRRAGAFERASSAVAQLRDAGVSTWLSFTLNARNVMRGSEILSLCENLRPDGVSLKVVRLSGNAGILQHLVPEPSRVRAVHDELKAQLRAKVRLYGPESGAECACGRTTLTLRPDGTVATCPYSPNSIGTALSETWKTLFSRARPSDSCVSQRDAQWPLAGENIQASKKQDYARRLQVWSDTMLRSNGIR